MIKKVLHRPGMAEQLEGVSARLEIEFPHNFTREAHCGEQWDAHTEEKYIITQES